MDRKQIFDEDGNALNIITHNGITFLSYDRDQAYFDRKRSKRLRKKLKVGESLVLIYRHSMAFDIADFAERHGLSVDDSGFCILDKMIDMSYTAEDCLRKDYSFATGHETGKDGKRFLSSLWVVSAPDKATFDANIESLREEFAGVVDYEEIEPENDVDGYPFHYD